AEPSWPSSGAAPAAVLAAPAPARWTPRPDLQRPSHAWTNAVLGTALLGAAVVLVWNVLWGVPAAVGFVAAGVALGIVALGSSRPASPGDGPGVSLPSGSSSLSSLSSVLRRWGG